MSPVCPVYPKQQTFPEPLGTSHLCQELSFLGRLWASIRRATARAWALRKMGRARRQNRENPRCARKPLRLACAPSTSIHAFPQKDARGHASEGRVSACAFGVI